MVGCGGLGCALVKAMAALVVARELRAAQASWLRMRTDQKVVLAMSQTEVAAEPWEGPGYCLVLAVATWLAVPATRGSDRAVG